MISQSVSRCILRIARRMGAKEGAGLGVVAALLQSLDILAGCASIRYLASTAMCIPIMPVGMKSRYMDVHISV
jgi:hypothetical protein